MPTIHSTRAALTALALAALLAACGGSADDIRNPTSPDDGRAQALKGGGDCTGSCSGGGGTPVAGSNPLPTSAPVPGVLMRESFGPGPAGIRPKGGKGDLRSTFIGTTLGGFWAEWPGSKNKAWITPAGEATWKFTAGTNGGPNPNPNEMASPLEVDTVYGQVWSDVSDGATGGYPTALLPMTWPATAWSMSIEALSSPVAGSYVALGVTDSGSTLGNLVSASKVSLLVRMGAAGSSLSWELWQGGAARTLLASGPVEDLSFNQLKLSYDPATQMLSVSVNGTPGGSYPVALGAPRYAAFEGLGTVDNFVVRSASAVTP